MVDANTDTDQVAQAAVERAQGGLHRLDRAQGAGRAARVAGRQGPQRERDRARLPHPRRGALGPLQGRRGRVGALVLPRSSATPSRRARDAIGPGGAGALFELRRLVEEMEALAPADEGKPGSAKRERWRAHRAAAGVLPPARAASIDAGDTSLSSTTTSCARWPTARSSELREQLDSGRRKELKPKCTSRRALTLPIRQPRSPSTLSGRGWATSSSSCSMGSPASTSRCGSRPSSPSSAAVVRRTSTACSSAPDSRSGSNRS